MTLPVSGKPGFMLLSGKYHDERDESVICHEYGHWVYGTLRDAGRFMSGDHSSKNEINGKLAYSEGLATFFGQEMICSERYYDGNGKYSLDYSIENPPKIDEEIKKMKNEAYVAASLWDIVDTYPKNSESWDEVTNDLEDVLQTNIDVVMKANLAPVNPKNILDSFLAYDCTIFDFYNKFIENHITQNSEEAYRFWRIYKKNGMQFDKTKPKIKLNGSFSTIIAGKETTRLSFELFDNVKVSKVELYLNGKRLTTVNEPDKIFTFDIQTIQLKDGLNKISLKAFDYAGKTRTYKNGISKVYPAEDFFKASIDSNEYIDYNNMTYRQEYEVEYIDIINNNMETSNSKLSLHKYETENEIAITNPTNDVIQELASQYSLSYQDEFYGTLAPEESSIREINILEGQDYSLLLDDSLGDFELTLTDPNGNVYTNIEDSEDPIIENEAKTQAVLNMGSSGLMVFHPTCGTWTYSIKNRGTTSDYCIGIYTKLSAPVITNEEELLKIQDGTSVDLKGVVSISNQVSVATGSAITVASGSAITVASGSAISIHLTGENSEIDIQDIIKDCFDEFGNFTYTFHDLPDDHYKVELYIIGEDGGISWKKNCEIIVNSKIPEIELDEDYKYYIYGGTAVIQGTAVNSSDVYVYLNGEEVPIYNGGNSESDYIFGTENMQLKLGDNQLMIVAETETGRTVTKQLTLHSISEEECYQDIHQPKIESVLFDGKEEPIVKDNSRIEVKLSDSNVSNYKVFAVFDDEIYYFTPNADNFTLDLSPGSNCSGNNALIIYAVSKWQMMDFIELEVMVDSNPDVLSIMKQPEDIVITVDQTAKLDLDEVFGGKNYEVETDLGSISDGKWTFSSKTEDIYDVTIRAFTEDTEKIVTFSVIVEASDGFNIEFDTNNGEMNDTEYYVYYGEKYGKLPKPSRTGYNFLGWFTEKVGGKQVEETTIVDENDSHILYAHWDVLSIPITFDANGGVLTSTSKTVNYGEEYGELPVPEKANAIFIGWYTQLNGGTEVTANSIVNVTTAQKLYAHWNSTNYNITFSACGGSVSTTSKQVVYKKTYGTLPTPTYAGYTFEGWYTKEIGGDKITESSTVTQKSQHTLYAHWKEGIFTITFQANGGTVSVTSKRVIYKSMYEELPIPTRVNYTFLGWYTQPTGGTQVTAISMVNITTTQTLYAQWSGIECKVTFDAKGGQITTTSKNVAFGNKYGTIPIPTKTGHTFVGWYTQEVGGTYISEDSIVNNPDNHTLYAHWYGNYYNVVLNANGGKIVITQGKSNYYFDTYNVAPMYGSTYGGVLGYISSMMRAGYDFDGWYTEAVGGDRITESTIVQVTATQTLYAHWKEAAYKIYFFSNGINISTKEVTYKGEYGLLPIPTREHYIFKGWYTEQTYRTEITASSIMDVTSNQTLYARWEGESCEVTFNANGGSVTANGKSVKYGSVYGTMPIPTKTGHTFVGWYTQEVGGTYISVDSIVNNPDNHTLYAHWYGNNYNILLDANGGKITFIERNQYLYFDTYNFSALYGGTYGIVFKQVPSMMRAGYDFVGWYTQKEGGEHITDSTIVQTAASQTLYAHWKEATYKIYFYSNGTNITTKDVIYKGEYGLLPIPTREHYIFKGWYTQPTAGIEITASSIMDVAVNQSLYARWIGESYVVTLNSNGGTINQNSINVEYGSVYGTIPLPTRAGYTFVGWYTQETGGNYLTSSSTVTQSSDHTLYAHWNGNSYLITLDGNGGLFGSSKISNFYATNDNKYGTMSIPVRAGYDFVGWYTQLEGGEEITSTTIVQITSAQTLYAHWKEATFNVSFYANGSMFDSKKVTYKSSYGKLPIPTKEHYTFDGWYTQQSGGDLITSVSEMNSTQNQTLYAHWVGNKYVVTFNATEGSVNPNSITVIYGNTYGKLPTPKRVNYEFLGWYDFDNHQITENTLVTLESSQQLFAKWIGVKSELSFDVNGGTQQQYNKTVYYGGTYGSLPEISRTGYEFGGWYLNGERIYKDSIVNINTNSTLYARWIPDTVILHLYYDSDSSFYYTVIVTYGEPYGKLPILQSNELNTFLGWFDTANNPITANTIVDYSHGNASNKTITLRAHWAH